MASAQELTLRFMDGFNNRDRSAIRALLAQRLEYVRPGGGLLTTPDEVMAQYERDWELASEARVEVREMLESGHSIMVEITVHATIGGRSESSEGALAHRWHDGKLVRYRLYADPFLADFAAVRRGVSRPSGR
jgi:ketosteroid isomerase-like protein